MSNTLTIARREFRGFFNSPVAYIVLGVYLVAAGALFFFIMGGGVFVRGTTSMRAFFGLAPWLFMIIAPAIAMRLIAEERKTGTFEILMTLPVREAEVVCGKFLGAMGMIGMALAFTLPFAATLDVLTAEGFQFDWGPVVGGYVGTFFLAATFVSVSLWASALTSNQIVSFMLGLALCFGLLMVGNVAYLLPDRVGAVLQYFSVTEHFENVSRGVIDTRDFIFYVSLTAMGLLLTVDAVRSARR